MIRLLDINKNYGEKTVFENFSLDIERNKILAVLGPSGCGKSTLLNILSNLTPYQGSIENRPQSVSYIFQDDRLIDNLTVRENIGFVCPDKHSVDNMLKSVELTKAAGKYPKELSGGMVKRVSIARAFCYESEIILMDEPFSNLDLGLKLRLTELFKEVRKQSMRTVIMVTHSIDEALFLADRITVLHNSALLADIDTHKESHTDIRSRLIQILQNL